MNRSILFYCVLFCMCLFTATAAWGYKYEKLPIYSIIHETDINVFANKVNINYNLGYQGGDVIIERFGANNTVAYVMQMWLNHDYR